MTTPIHRGMPCDPLTVEEGAMPAESVRQGRAGWIPVIALAVLVAAAVLWRITNG